jgi:hemoglobin
MPESLYDRVGGEPFFVDLVNHFYDQVDYDPVLRPFYPRDLAPSRRHLLFLAQYWGGPPTYNAGTRPSPAAHAPRPIRHRATRARDAGSAHMLAAVDASPPYPTTVKPCAPISESAATSLINRFPSAAPLCPRCTCVAAARAFLQGQSARCQRRPPGA